MKKTMMYLPDEMHRYLVREAKARGISMAEVAREAIAQYQATREGASGADVSALFGVLGVDVVDPDMSETADAALTDYFGADGEWERENGLADCTR